MILCFTLSMPNVGSWNGKWTGENNLYARIKNFGRSKKGAARAQKIIDEGGYYYNFGDGWGANVDVKEVDAKQAQKIRKGTKGFAGYDWMIDSIMDHGKIQNSQGN